MGKSYLTEQEAEEAKNNGTRRQIRLSVDIETYVAYRWKLRYNGETLKRNTERLLDQALRAYVELGQDWHKKILPDNSKNIKKERKNAAKRTSKK